MKSAFNGLVSLAGIALLLGCATQAPSTSAGTSPGGAPAGAAASLANTNQPAASPTAQSTSTANDKDDAATLGYDRVIVQGKPLYCRMEATPGTRITKKVCRSKEELDAEQAAAQQYIDSAQRNSGATGTGQPAGPY